MRCEQRETKKKKKDKLKKLHKYSTNGLTTNSFTGGQTDIATSLRLALVEPASSASDGPGTKDVVSAR